MIEALPSSIHQIRPSLFQLNRQLPEKRNQQKIIIIQKQSEKEIKIPFFMMSSKVSQKKTF